MGLCCSEGQLSDIVIYITLLQGRYKFNLSYTGKEIYHAMSLWEANPALLDY